jgi:hypothetical protein
MGFRVTDSEMRLNTELHCAFVDMVSLRSFLFGMTCTNRRREAAKAYKCSENVFPLPICAAVENHVRLVVPDVSFLHVIPCSTSVTSLCRKGLSAILKSWRALTLIEISTRETGWFGFYSLVIWCHRMLVPA